jgi:hypothetical protein
MVLTVLKHVYKLQFRFFISDNPFWRRDFLDLQAGLLPGRREQPMVNALVRGSLIQGVSNVRVRLLLTDAVDCTRCPGWHRARDMDPESANRHRNVGFQRWHRTGYHHITNLSLLTRNVSSYIQYPGTPPPPPVFPEPAFAAHKGIHSSPPGIRCTTRYPVSARPRSFTLSPCPRSPRLRRPKDSSTMESGQ